MQASQAPAASYVAKAVAKPSPRAERAAAAAAAAPAVMVRADGREFSLSCGRYGHKPHCRCHVVQAEARRRSLLLRSLAGAGRPQPAQAQQARGGGEGEKEEEGGRRSTRRLRQGPRKTPPAPAPGRGEGPMLGHVAALPSIGLAAPAHKKARGQGGGCWGNVPPSSSSSSGAEPDSHARTAMPCGARAGQGQGQGQGQGGLGATPGLPLRRTSVRGATVVARVVHGDISLGLEARAIPVINNYDVSMLGQPDDLRRETRRTRTRTHTHAHTQARPAQCRSGRRMDTWLAMMEHDVRTTGL